MPSDALLFCFDYVDPLSFVVQEELHALAAAGDLPPIRRLPMELRPPPEPVLDPEGEVWTRRWIPAVAAAAPLGLTLAPQGLVPWTRKAHELVLHAEARGAGDAAHRAVFEAVFRRGLDIGRVDVLVDVAGTLGLDPNETKAVLDVDRHTGEVARLREAALERGVTEPPSLVLGTHILQGFHNRDALRTFLLR